MAHECVGDAQALRLCKWIGLAAAKTEAFCACPLGRQCNKLGAVAHQALIGFSDPVPFEHGEFGMMQRPALAVSIDRAQAEDALLAGSKQLLAGEFRRGVEVELTARPVGTDRLGGKSRQMSFVAGRDLQGSGFDLDEIAVGEPTAHGGCYGVAQK